MEKNFICVLVVTMIFSDISVYAAPKCSQSKSWEEKSRQEKNDEIEEILEQSEHKTKRRKQKKNISIDSLNALEGMTEQELEDYFSAVYSGATKTTAKNNTKGGLVTDPVTYLHNTVGKSSDKYSVTKTKYLSGVGNATCNSLGGHNNCTLTALYNVMLYYRKQGYSKIPSTNSTLYSKIKTQASELSYNYNKNIGLSVTHNDDLVKNTWKKGFNYSTGSGSNNYLWTASDLTKAIDNGRPYLFSIASGIYYDHTVTVYGYKIYKNTRTNKSYTFLLIYDGWSNSTRFLPLTGVSYAACMTSITPPSSKTK